MIENDKMIPFTEAIQLIGIFYISYFINIPITHIAIFAIILILLGKINTYISVNEIYKKFFYYLLGFFLILLIFSTILEIYIINQFNSGDFSYTYNLIYGLLLIAFASNLTYKLNEKYNKNLVTEVVDNDKETPHTRKDKFMLYNLNIADNFIINGDYKSGIETFNKILKIYPSEVSALFGKAQALYQLGEFDYALNIINCYIGKDIDKVTKIITYNILSGIYYKTGNINESLKYNNLILELDPGNEIATFNKAKMELSTTDSFW